VTGQVRIDVAWLPWWQWPMSHFADQARKHCHDCGVPLRGYGELAQADRLPLDADHYGLTEQVSATHQAVYRPKRKGRAVELVTLREQLGPELEMTTRYLQNGRLR
jgi:hypothetical protein